MRFRIAVLLSLLFLTCSTCGSYVHIRDRGTAFLRSTSSGIEASIEIDGASHAGDIHELVGTNDYGPDVTRLYGDSVAFGLFRDLGLQRLRTWCAFGSQLGYDLGFEYRHVIFNGTTLDDARNPAYYNWTYLDMLFNVTYSVNALPLFTFTGCPISLARNGKPNDPPKNVTVYAEVVAQVVRHYVQGWPNDTGHFYALDYIEIGNEPDFNQFWNGTMGEFFELYGNVSLRLRQLGISFSIGGPGLANIFSSWAPQFLAYVATHNLPLDFFSWHGYDDDASMVVKAMVEGRRVVSAQGFQGIDLVFDEWGKSLNNDTGWDTMGMAVHGANVLIGAAYVGITIACFAMAKDAPIAYQHPLWGWKANFGLLTRNPTTAKFIYHALEPFASMKQTPIILNFSSTSTIQMPLSISFLATRNGNSTLSNVLIANNEDRSISCSVLFENFSADTPSYTIRTLHGSASVGTDWSGREISTDQLPSKGLVVLELAPQSITWITLQNLAFQPILLYAIMVVVLVSSLGLAFFILRRRRIRTQSSLN
nr:hypothetical protein [Candidatus Njordarchaeota archaeon]